MSCPGERFCTADQNLATPYTFVITKACAVNINPIASPENRCPKDRLPGGHDDVVRTVYILGLTAYYLLFELKV